MIAALLLACAPHHPATEVPARVELMEQFAIRFRDHTLAGVAVVLIEGDTLTVSALGPAGTQIFRVVDDGDTVQATVPDDAWRPWLERLPLSRDMRLAHTWACPEELRRCAVAGGVLRQSRTEDDLAWERRWRGPGGPVSATIWEGKAQLHDPRRGYTVILAGPDLHGPGDPDVR